MLFSLINLVILDPFLIQVCLSCMYAKKKCSAPKKILCGAYLHTKQKLLVSSSLILSIFAKAQLYSIRKI